MTLSQLAFAALLAVASPESPDNSYYSNIKSDEQVVLFNTDAYLDETRENWHIPIHAWVYENDFDWPQKQLFHKSVHALYGISLDKSNRDIFHQRTSFFTADNERNKRLVVTIGQHSYLINATGANGHSRDEIIVPAGTIEVTHDGQIMPINVELKSGDDRQFQGAVRFLQPHGLSIISDIDDTIKNSYVLNKKQLIKATFYERFIAIPEMVNAYRHCFEFGVDLHLVSSSPWQLYSDLTAFLSESQFPWAQLSLKSIRFKDSSFLNLFKSGEITKPQQIRALIERFPQRQFILIGDSGEADPEAYSIIAETYPENIAAILIRQVTNANNEVTRFDHLRSTIDIELVQFTDDNIESLLEPLCEGFSAEDVETQNVSDSDHTAYH